MYKLVLVDDEELVINGFKRKIDWESLKIDIVGVAYDGLEALQVIKKTSPDIIITDIKMPVMDGLKLVENIRKNGEQIEVIILSGHEEFSYAKKAIKMGVDEYLLKPTSKQDIINAIQNVISKINNKKQNEHTLQQMINKNKKQDKELIKQEILNIMMNQAENEPASFYKIKNKLGLYVKKKSVVILIEIDGIKEIEDQEKKLLIFGAVNIANEIINNKDNIGWSSRIERNQIVAIMFYEQNLEDKEIQNKNLWIMHEIKEAIKNYLKISITVVISSVLNDLSQLHKEYILIKEMMQNKVIFGKDKIYFAESMMELIKELHKKEKKKAELIDVISNSNGYLPKKEIQDFLTIEENYQGWEYEEIIEILNILFHIHFINNKNEKIINQIKETKEKVASCESLHDINEYIQALLQMIEEARSSEKYGQLVSYVVQYIQSNYMNNIKLKDIAQEMYVTSNYLTTLFRKETGISFKKYLTKVRMDKAKLMLEKTEYKINEIVYLVGYEDEAYFSRMFKKCYGISPMQYRKNI